LGRNVNAGGGEVARKVRQPLATASPQVQHCPASRQELD
jgi:hypothetical protein